MEKSGNLRDKKRSEIVVEEINRFKKLIQGHRRLLEAIGNL
jgi:hypothetical protein